MKTIINKFILKFIFPVFLLFVWGCGHSIVRTDRGTGFHLRVPNPFQQSDSLIDLKLGNIDTTIAIVRGNTTFDSNSAKGGFFTGAGGISERFALSTNPQLNEGYMTEVLTSPNVSNETKIEIAKYLSSSKAPTVSDSKLVTIGAASGSGNETKDIKPEKTGMDNLVNKTSNNKNDVIKHTDNVTGETTSNITFQILNSFYLIFILIFIIILFKI